MFKFSHDKKSDSNQKFGNFSEWISEKFWPGWNDSDKARENTVFCSFSALASKPLYQCLPNWQQTCILSPNYVQDIVLRSFKISSYFGKNSQQTERTHQFLKCFDRRDLRVIEDTMYNSFLEIVPYTFLYKILYVRRYLPITGRPTVYLTVTWLFPLINSNSFNVISIPSRVNTSLQTI